MRRTQADGGGTAGGSLGLGPGDTRSIGNLRCQHGACTLPQKVKGLSTGGSRMQHPPSRGGSLAAAVTASGGSGSGSSTAAMPPGLLPAIDSSWCRARAAACKPTGADIQDGRLARLGVVQATINHTLQVTTQKVQGSTLSQAASGAMQHLHQARHVVRHVPVSAAWFHLPPSCHPRRGRPQRGPWHWPAAPSVPPCTPIQMQH